MNVESDLLIRAIGDLNELSSSRDHLIMIEYSEPQPPVFLNQGMSSFIVNWIKPTIENVECRIC